MNSPATLEGPDDFTGEAVDHIHVSPRFIMLGIAPSTSHENGSMQCMLLAPGATFSCRLTGMIASNMMQMLNTRRWFTRLPHQLIRTGRVGT